MEQGIFLEQNLRRRSTYICEWSNVSIFPACCKMWCGSGRKTASQKYKTYHTTSGKRSKCKAFSKAQEAISLSYELYKQEKKVQSKEKREAEKQRRRLIKVQKAKQKHRGH